MNFTWSRVSEIGVACALFFVGMVCAGFTGILCYFFVADAARDLKHLLIPSLLTFLGMAIVSPLVMAIHLSTTILWRPRRSLRNRIGFAVAGMVAGLASVGFDALFQTLDLPIAEVFWKDVEFYIMLLTIIVFPLLGAEASVRGGPGDTEPQHAFPLVNNDYQWGGTKGTNKGNQ